MRLITVSTAETLPTPQPTRRWPKAIVGIGVVAVVGAGLGAYLGIRAVAGPGSAPAAGQPPARTDAAIAYDAADGTVVMFGGQGRSGSLADTWTWDGSAWTQQHPRSSPPALSGAHMTYDPAGHDVLLIGGDHVSRGPLAGSSCSSSGSTGSGSASGSGGSGTKWIPPSDAKPAAAPVDGNVSAPPISNGCVSTDSQNAATWVWNGSDWSKASGSTPAVGFGGWNLVTDPVSGRALLLATQPWIAEPDLPAVQPAIACPMEQTVTNGVTAPGCPVYPIVSHSYSWDGHAWKEITTKKSAALSGFIGSSVIVDGVTGRLAAFSGQGLMPATPVQCPTCKGGVPVPIDNNPCCSGTISYWDGTTWKQSKRFESGPAMFGGTLVGDAATHSDVYLTADGQTWVWTGVWTRKHPGTTPTALQATAAVYDAQSSQVLLFGGISTTSRESGLYDQTWTWDGSDWTLRGGSTTPAVRIPVPSPVSVPPSLPCNGSAPPAVPPGAPEPQIACSGGGSWNGGGAVSGSGGSPSGTGGTSTGAPNAPVASGAVGL